MKVYPEEGLRDFIDRHGCIVQSDLDENQLTPSELDKEKIKWSELSDEQKQDIIKAIAEMWISHHKKLHREMMDDLLTPFWVKWGRKLKAKFSKKSHEQQ